jgi:hypothetical protein
MIPKYIGYYANLEFDGYVKDPVVCIGGVSDKCIKDDFEDIMTNTTTITETGEIPSDPTKNP